MGMDENTISQLMDRFYALGQMSSQMQSIIEEIDYLMEGNADSSVQAIRELGVILNGVLEQEADQLVGLRETASMLDTMVVTIEHMANRESVKRLLEAVENYKERISGYREEVSTIAETPDPEPPAPKPGPIILPPDDSIDSHIIF